MSASAREAGDEGGAADEGDDERDEDRRTAGLRERDGGGEMREDERPQLEREYADRPAEHECAPAAPPGEHRERREDEGGDRHGARPVDARRGEAVAGERLDDEVEAVMVQAARQPPRAEMDVARLVDDRLQPGEGEGHRDPEGGEGADPGAEVAAAREQSLAGRNAVSGIARKSVYVGCTSESAAESAASVRRAAATAAGGSRRRAPRLRARTAAWPPFPAARGACTRRRAPARELDRDLRENDREGEAGRAEDRPAHLEEERRARAGRARSTRAARHWSGRLPRGAPRAPSRRARGGTRSPGAALRARTRRCRAGRASRASRACGSGPDGRRSRRGGGPGRTRPRCPGRTRRGRASRA